LKKSKGNSEEITRISQHFQKLYFLGNRGAMPKRPLENRGGRGWYVAKIFCIRISSWYAKPKKNPKWRLLEKSKGNSEEIPRNFQYFQKTCFSGFQNNIFYQIAFRNKQSHGQSHTKISASEWVCSRTPIYDLKWSILRGKITAGCSPTACLLFWFIFDSFPH